MATFLVVAVSTFAIPIASARPALDLCSLIDKNALEERIGTPFGFSHSLSTKPEAAECHFAASAVGGTDVAIFASTNVPHGAKHSQQGSSVGTPDTFASSYGKPTPVAGIGTAAYVAFTKGDPAQGALLVEQGSRHAVVVVLVGHYVTLKNTITRAQSVARLVLKLPQLRGTT